MDYTQLPEPKNNMDAQLQYIASGGVTPLPKPLSTTEAYLDFIARMLIDKFNSVITVVPQLPVEGEENIIYVAPNTDTESDNLYAEYMWINGKWEKVGSAISPITIDWGQITNIPQYFPIDTTLDYDWTGKQTINGQDVIDEIEVTNTTTSDTPSLTFTKVGNKYNVEIAFPKTLSDEASNITYDNTTSGLTSNNVQDVIDEIVGIIPTLTDLINDNAPSLNTTYSSQKIDDLLANIKTISKAIDVEYDDDVTLYGATNVQNVLEIIKTKLDELYETKTDTKIQELKTTINANSWIADNDLYKYVLNHNLDNKTIFNIETTVGIDPCILVTKKIDNNNLEIVTTDNIDTNITIFYY